MELQNDEQKTRENFLDLVMNLTKRRKDVESTLGKQIGDQEPFVDTEQKESIHDRTLNEISKHNEHSTSDRRAEMKQEHLHLLEHENKQQNFAVGPRHPQMT